MSSYSKTSYIMIKKEATENVAVKPDVSIPFLSEDISVEWSGEYSQAIVNNRFKNYRPIERAIPAPEGKISFAAEPALLGHFLSSNVGALTSGIYMPVSSVTGTFQVGETITGGTSSATADIVAISSENDYLLLENATGSFTAAETITGGTSSATATMTKYDAQAIGHQYLVPQDDLNTTYTVEIGFDNEAFRYTGVRFAEMNFSIDNNQLIAEAMVMARSAFKMGRVTAVTSSGAGAKTITLDQTTGLIATDTIKAFRPGTGFLDFSAASVKTHTVGTVASETSITITNLQTALAVGDLIVLAPQTTAYTGEREFTWAGGAYARVGNSITAALTSTNDNIEEWETGVVNTLEYRHAANGTNLVNRFPAKVFTAGCEAAGKITKTYVDMTMTDRLRSERKVALQVLFEADALPNAASFNYLLDIRTPDIRFKPYAPNVSEDDLLVEEIEFEIFKDQTAGYAVKMLLVNEEDGTDY